MQSTAINMKQLLSCFTDESVTDDSVFLSPQGFREYDARWWYGFSGSIFTSFIRLEVGQNPNH